VKKRKISKRILSIGMAVVMLFGVVVLGGCWSEISRAQRSIEFFLGETLEWPENMTILRNFQPTSFVHGRNPQNTLLQLEEVPEYFLYKYGFEKAFESSQIPAMGFGIGIAYAHDSEGFSPPWHEGFYWFGAHPAFVLFFPNQLWLMLIVIPS